MFNKYFFKLLVKIFELVNQFSPINLPLQNDCLKPDSLSENCPYENDEILVMRPAIFFT